MTTLKLNNAFPFLYDNFLNYENNFAPKTSFKSLPAVNVSENVEGFHLELAAPGLQKEDFKIKIENNRLSISSEKEENTEETKDKYTRKEFSYSKFVRSFVLPQTVDSEKISANYQDGILKLEIPKKEEAKEKGPKLIEIA